MDGHTIHLRKKGVSTPESTFLQVLLIDIVKNNGIENTIACMRAIGITLLSLEMDQGDRKSLTP